MSVYNGNRRNCVRQRLPRLTKGGNSPGCHIYDNDEELDADAQGFVVVEHDSIDIVDNHFQPAHRLSQSWKVSYVTHTHT